MPKSRWYILGIGRSAPLKSCMVKIKLTSPLTSKKNAETITILDQRRELLSHNSLRRLSSSGKAAGRRTNRWKRSPPTRAMAAKMCIQRNTIPTKSNSNMSGFPPEGMGCFFD